MVASVSRLSSRSLPPTIARPASVSCSFHSPFRSINLVRGQTFVSKRGFPSALTRMRTGRRGVPAQAKSKVLMTTLPGWEPCPSIHLRIAPSGPVNSPNAIPSARAAALPDTCSLPTWTLSCIGAVVLLMHVTVSRAGRPGSTQLTPCATPPSSVSKPYVTASGSITRRCPAIVRVVPPLASIALIG